MAASRPPWSAAALASLQEWRAREHSMPTAARLAAHRRSTPPSSSSAVSGSRMRPIWTVGERQGAGEVGALHPTAAQATRFAC